MFAYLARHTGWLVVVALLLLPGQFGHAEGDPTTTQGKLRVWGETRDEWFLIGLRQIADGLL
jgi:hypothetical protein